MNTNSQHFKCATILYRVRSGTGCVGTRRSRTGRRTWRHWRRCYIVVGRRTPCSSGNGRRRRSAAWTARRSAPPAACRCDRTSPTRRRRPRPTDMRSTASCWSRTPPPTAAAEAPASADHPRLQKHETWPALGLDMTDRILYRIAATVFRCLHSSWHSSGLNCGRFCFWRRQSVFFSVCVCNILGTAERICAKFTGKTCLVPGLDEFEHQGQRSRLPETKNGIFRPFPRPACGLCSVKRL